MGLKVSKKWNEERTSELCLTKHCLILCRRKTVIVLSVSYSLSRLRFKGRKLIMNVVLVLGLFPGFLTMITLYFLLKQLGMTQSGAIPGLILIYCASSGMGYYISKGFFDTIPKSLDESARIDGANGWQSLIHITLPNVMPSITICTFLSLTNAFKLYDQNLVLTNGAPVRRGIGATERLALNIAKTFTTANQRGVAQAKAVLFFLLVTAISLIQLRATRSKEVQQ